jgi:hypothetical protein
VIGVTNGNSRNYSKLFAAKKAKNLTFADLEKS